MVFVERPDHKGPWLFLLGVPPLGRCRETSGDLLQIRVDHFLQVDTFEGALHFFYDAVESFLLDYKVHPMERWLEMCVHFQKRNKMLEDVETKRGNRFVYPSESASGLTFSSENDSTKNLGDLVMNIMMICSWLHHVFILVYIYIYIYIYIYTQESMWFLIARWTRGRTYPNWEYQTLQMVLTIWNRLVFGCFW